VLGRAPHEKYEAQGGPGIAQCLQVLRSSQAAPADISHFLCAQLAFWLLAATDGHAKNFSIFLLPGGGYRMTPLYDVISVWPVIGDGPNRVAWQEAKLAMAVRSRNVHYELARIQTRHWLGLAQRSGAEGVWEAMQALVARVKPAIEAVQMRLPAGFPERTAQAIFEGLRQQSRAWEAGLPGLV
jgi:serine/threonine-protein kinase HipA